MRIRRRILPLVPLVALLTVTLAGAAEPTFQRLNMGDPVTIAPAAQHETYASRTFVAIGALYLNGFGATVGYGYQFDGGTILLAQVAFVRDEGDDGYARPSDFNRTGCGGYCDPPTPPVVAKTPESSRVGIAATWLFGPGARAVR
jgi:hypothetical protein